MGGRALSAAQGAALVSLALAAVGSRLLDVPFEPAEPDGPELTEPAATFVTLERGGALRGCVGTLDAVRPLYLDVVRNALRAMTDPRMPALVPAEWVDLDVTVSVLGPAEPLAVCGVEELAGVLRVGADGLVLTDGHRRATFLPAVWHKLPEPERFVAALVAKGGWSAAEAAELRAARYPTTEFADRAPRASLAECFPGTGASGGVTSTTRPTSSPGAVSATDGG